MFHTLDASRSSGRIIPPTEFITVDSYTEIRFLDSFHIYQVESQYAINMFLIVSQVFAIRAQVVYIGIVEFLSLSNTKYFIAFFRIQEFSMFIE